MKNLYISLMAIAILFSGQPARAASTLVKSPSFAAVYYVADDGKRYVFPNEKTYGSWFDNFSEVTEITDAELGAIAIGGNVTIRPGSALVKITTDPKTYAVSHGGVLHWVTNEDIAAALYGEDWNTDVVDVPDAFFINYSIGSPINSPADYSPAMELESSQSISSDKALTGGGVPDPIVTPPPVQPPVPTPPPAPPTPPAPPRYDGHYDQITLSIVRYDSEKNIMEYVLRNDSLELLAVIEERGEISYENSIEQFRYTLYPGLDVGKEYIVRIIPSVPNPKNFSFKSFTVQTGTSGFVINVPLPADYVVAQ